MGPMPEPHDLAIFCRGGHGQAVWQTLLLHRQAVVAHGLEVLFDAGKDPFPSALTAEVLPCISRLAAITLPPKAWAIDWWPRQTPRMGILPGKYLIVSRDTPADVRLARSR
jgi:hypothetical protein